MSQSRYLDLDSAIADAIRRDFRAMVHALAEADVARAIQTRDEQMDVSVGRPVTLAEARQNALRVYKEHEARRAASLADERLREAFAEEGEQ